MLVGSSRSGVTVGEIVEGRYRIIRPIDEGGMSTVFLAEHVLIKRRVAVKLLRPEVLAGEGNEAIDRFMNEASAAGTLGHPNIVESTDMGFTRDGLPFIVFEYLEGTLLTAEIYRVRGMTLRRALVIATQIASALEAAHDAGIIHRDLKTDNVFLTIRDGYTDHVKVLDFGISHFLDPSARPTARARHIVGTPEFLAPEQILTPDRLDQRVDIYALGLVLYEMIAARRAFPFDGDTDHLLERIVRAPPEPLSRNEAPAAVQEFLFDRLLAKNPDDRLATMRDVQSALSELSGQLRPSGNIAPLRRTPLSIPVATPRTDGGLDELIAQPASESAARGARESNRQWHGAIGSDGIRKSDIDGLLAQTPAGEVQSKASRAKSGSIGLVLALLGVVVAGGATSLLWWGGGTIETPAAEREAASLLATRLTATLDQAASGLRIRAEGVASSPMLRAAIETDAATLADMVRDSDFMFKPGDGETFEVFRTATRSGASLLRIPKHATPLEARSGIAFSVIDDRLIAAAGVPLTGGSGAHGVVALAGPIDLDAIRNSITLTSARIEGLNAPLQLVNHTSGPTVEQRIPLALSDASIRPTLVVALAAPVDSDPLGWLRVVGWIGGGLLLVGGLAIWRR